MEQQKINALKRITEEYKDLNKNPMINFGITVGLINDENMFEWKCSLFGPKDTSYKGGMFYLKITFPPDYPNTKPEIVFLTPIYHLNIKFYVDQKEPLGHVCINTLTQWKPEDSIRKVLSEIYTLLHQNNHVSAYDYINLSRTNEFKNNRPLFEKKAKYFTQKYAQALAPAKEYKTTWDFTYNP